MTLREWQPRVSESITEYLVRWDVVVAAGSLAVCRENCAAFRAKLITVIPRGTYVFFHHICLTCLVEKHYLRVGKYEEAMTI